MKVVHALDEIEAPPSLTQRQREFCIQLIRNGGHKADAARQSGYALKNAASTGCRLLKREDIQAYITALRTEALKRSHITPMSALVNDMEKVQSGAVASVASFFDLSEGVLRLRNLDELSPACANELENVEFDNRGKVTGYRLKRNGLPALQRMLELIEA